MNPRRTFSRTLPAALALLAISLQLPAQFQVNNQVNNSLYGGGTTGSVRYAPASTSVAMPSEVRYSYVKAGMTPSQYRMNQSAVGPLPAQGAMSYINAKPSYSWLDKPTPPAAKGSSAFTTMGSIKYATPAPTTALVTPKPLGPPTAASP